MIAIVLSVIYVIGLVPAWRWVFRAFYSDTYEPDGADVAFCAALGTLICWFWPVIAPFALIWSVANGDPDTAARALGGESRAEKVHRLEKEAHARERRIRELEREAGIR